MGLNLTIPHKTAVLSIARRLDESARKFGAANTLKFFPDGSTVAYNTDVTGYLSCLKSHGVTLSGKHVCILGCGGAGGALAKASAYEGAAELCVTARRPESMQRLSDELNALGLPATIRCVRLDDIQTFRNADIIVNATPVGLKPDDPSVLPAEAFRPGQFVLDIIPTKKFPPTAALASSAGAIAVDGLEFLVEQAAKAFEIWTGLEADRQAMRAAL